MRFAGVLWELVESHAYRGYSADSFFKLPPVTRAIVLLKAKAKLSRQQIATALKIRISEVDAHLENSRLSFSSGKSWLEGSPAVFVRDNSWMPDCPHWAVTAQPIQEVFAHYAGGDLDPDSGQKLQSHLLVCTSCRGNFNHFKKQYLDWADAVPAIETDPSLKKHLTDVARLALKVSRKGPPSIWPGLRKVLADGQTRFVLGAASVLMVAHFILTRHHQ
jgi:hypothetical protein